MSEDQDSCSSNFRWRTKCFFSWRFSGRTWRGWGVEACNVGISVPTHLRGTGSEHSVSDIWCYISSEEQFEPIGPNIFPATVNSSGFGCPIDLFKSKERTKIIGGFTTSSPSALSIFSFSSLPALGTRCVQFQPFIEKEPQSTTDQQNSFQNIGFQLPYQKHSQEELRLADYAVGVRYSGNYKFGGFGTQ